MTKMGNVFVSGHRHITYEEFLENYAVKLDEAMVSGLRVFVCDYFGVDRWAQEYLRDHGYDKVSVAYMGATPRNYVGGFHLIGGFKSDEERDSFCTDATDYDIAWVKYPKSGTARNVERRAERRKDGTDDLA